MTASARRRYVLRFVCVTDSVPAAGPFLVESPSNQQFPILPDALIERLKPEFSCSHTQSFPNGTSAVRFCTSWATTDADIDALLDAVPINA